MSLKPCRICGRNPKVEQWSEYDRTIYIDSDGSEHANEFEVTRISCENCKLEADSEESWNNPEWPIGGCIVTERDADGRQHTYFRPNGGEDE